MRDGMRWLIGLFGYVGKGILRTQNGVIVVSRLPMADPHAGTTHGIGPIGSSPNRTHTFVPSFFLNSVERYQEDNHVKAHENNHVKAYDPGQVFKAKE